MKSTMKFFLQLILTAILLLILTYVNIIIQQQFSLYEHSTLITVILLIFGGGITLVQIMKLVIHILASGGQPSAWVLLAYQNGIITTALAYSREMIPDRIRRMIHFGSLGTVIILFVTMLYSFEMFKGKEGLFLSINLIENYYEHTFGPEAPVVRFMLFTEDNNLKKYLQDVLQISKDARRAGAKVVVARMPFGSIGGPKNADKVERLKQSIDSLGYVVFAIAPFPGNRPQNRDTYTSDITRTVFSSLPLDLGISHYRFHTDIIHWFPMLQFPAGKKMYSEIDVSLPVAKKFFGIADSVQPRRIGNEIVMDRIRIPVTESGKAYSDDYFQITPFLPVNANRGMFSRATDKNEEDVLQYWEDVYQPWSLYKSWDEKIENLDRYRKYIDGKVVIINWYDGSERSVLNYPFDGFFVSSVITGVLLDKSYTRNEWFFYALLLGSVVIVGMLVAVYSPLWSLFGSFLITISISMIGIWSFLSYRNIVEMPYIYVAVLLSYVVFSLVKMSWMVTDRRQVL